MEGLIDNIGMVRNCECLPLIPQAIELAEEAAVEGWCSPPTGCWDWLMSKISGWISWPPGAMGSFIGPLVKDGTYQINANKAWQLYKKGPMVRKSYLNPPKVVILGG